jgi:putative two-component system response regulator
MHAGHNVERMASLCGMVALRLGLPAERCALIRTASLLHDIGKLAIPSRILRKAGPLTAEERKEVEEHTTLGYRILRGSSSEVVRVAAAMALTHHERYDGKGYPHGLSGEQIPLEGRIAAVCDVFDALTEPRPYRPLAFTRDEAIRMIREERGKAFDPVVVDALLESLDLVDALEQYAA